MAEAWKYRLEGVSKLFRSYSGRPVAAVADLTLTVEQGEVLGLLGPAGAGKSTVLGLLAGRLRPTSGTVRRAKGEMVLLDEPTVPPASEEAAKLRAQLRGMAEGGQGAVVATACTALAHRLCDRVAVLHEGRLVALEPAEVFEPLLQAPHYRIRVQRYLAPRMLNWFDGLHAAATPAGETLLTGPLADAAALYGALSRIRDLNLPLLEVVAIDPVETLIRQRSATA